MGMARKAPDASYQRRFVVSHHAVERFRERVDEEFTARSNADLGNLLDERVQSAQSHQTVEDLRNLECTTRVFLIENRDGRTYYAVVRDETIVTVLDEKMLNLNFENGSWKTGPMNPAFRTALKGIKLPVVDGVEKRSPEPRPVVLVAPPIAPPTEPTPVIRDALAEAGVAYALALASVEDAQVNTVNAATMLREAESIENEQRAILALAEKAMHTAIAQRRSK